MSTRRQHRNLIYRLKRRYRDTVLCYTPVTSAVDSTTGKATRTYTCAVFNKAVVLHESNKAITIQDLAAYFAHGGGERTKKSRTIILDIADFPTGFVLDSETIIRYNGQRYNISTYELMENQRAYLLTVEGDTANMPLVMAMNVTTDVIMSDETEGSI